MKNALIKNLAVKLLPKLLDLALKLLEEALKVDINNDGKIGLK